MSGNGDGWSVGERGSDRDDEVVLAAAAAGAWVTMVAAVCGVEVVMESSELAIWRQRQGLWRLQ
uniref:DUF834 domain-containing protein n=1 Tax=Oryza rufipogon TaxID=4529 RepID=A0A0E0PW75_ORYRU